MTYFTAYFLLPKYFLKKKYSTFIILLLITTTIGAFSIRAIEFYWSGPLFLPFDVGDVLCTYKMFYKVLDNVYIASLVVIIKLMQQFIQKEKVNQNLSRQKLQAELQLLKNQLQPHFLFNTLNNLYGLVLTKDELAGDAVLKLSSLLSYMLYESEEQYISLRKEIKHLNEYIELEKMRYGDRLTLEFEEVITDDQILVAPLLLIAFLENSFKHGPSSTEKKAWIKILIRGDERNLYFQVENSIEAEVEQKSSRTYSGIGLKNVKKRLELLYPGRHELEIQKNTSYLVKLNLQHELSDNR